MRFSSCRPRLPGHRSRRTPRLSTTRRTTRGRSSRKEVREKDRDRRMAMTVGIMGFGRIGRNVFRILYKRDDILIGAVSDLGDAASVEYLLKFDTLFGRFPDEISAKDGHLYVFGRQIALLASQEKGVIPPWGALGVDTVIEATARRLTRAELERHLQAGAKRVILCEPPVDPLDLTVVNGINDHLVKLSLIHI